MPTTVNVSPLKINYLTESQYQTALNNGEINSNELYFTPSVDCLPLTEGGTGATNAADARTNLGAAAASHTHTMTQLSGTLSISQGGTGAVSAETARVALGITPENIGAAASDHSHNLFDLRGPLTIAKGGTGQTTRVGAMNALSDLGTAPITSTTDDTTANWEALRTGVAWYNATGKLNGQPTQYGLLLNINTSSSVHDMHQLWFTQADGNVLHRGGNASGWGSNGWRTLLDSVNYTSFVTPANIGAATTSHTHNTLNMTGVLTHLGDGWTEVLRSSSASDSTAARAKVIVRDNNIIQFNEYTSAGGSAVEAYLLPEPTATGSSTPFYGILTTKYSGTTADVNQSTNKSIATATYTNLTNLSLNAGTYVLIARFEFATNATGYRWAGIYTTSASSSTVNTWAKWQLPAISGAWMTGNITTIVKPTASTTYYLNVYQNSGSALNANGGLMAIRII